MRGKLMRKRGGNVQLRRVCEDKSSIVLVATVLITKSVQTSQVDHTSLGPYRADCRDTVCGTIAAYNFAVQKIMKIQS